MDKERGGGKKPNISVDFLYGRPLLPNVGLGSKTVFKGESIQDLLRYFQDREALRGEEERDRPARRHRGRGGGGARVRLRHRRRRLCLAARGRVQIQQFHIVRDAEGRLTD